jgi:hypothetical protein
MGRVNGQRENGSKERENGLRPSTGGQQLKAENSFVSSTLAERQLPERKSLPTAVGGGRDAVVKPSLRDISRA